VTKPVVNVVTAFGRAETLALALETAGFQVQVFDFSEALGPEWQRGAGPFPIQRKEFIPAQAPLLAESRRLPRGLTFWLKDGPIELGGPMMGFFENKYPFVKDLKSGRNSAGEFSETWLRNYMCHWASPTFHESWEPGDTRSLFPYNQELAVIPASLESRVMSFERYQTLELKYMQVQALHDVQFEGSRLVEVELDNGSPLAARAAQWVWCLSSEETEKLGAKVAQALFPRGMRKAAWRWIGFEGRTLRGSWSAGFPEYINVIGDVHLPWTYANHAILRWTEPDRFHAWMMVPAASATVGIRQQEWARDIETLLNGRLPMADWKLTEKAPWLCPNSPVFDEGEPGEGAMAWKNGDWIAPETLPRLDLSARLEREAKCFQKLVQWKNEQMKKQGARGDLALHSP
jgi:hypothetical protein